MSAPARELVVLVDEAGRPTRTCEKARVHGTHTPLHLAFSCYGFDGTGRLLLTRRADTKASFPGLWTNTCCGHPGPGESIVDAARRRMAYELGLSARSPVLALPDFRYSARMNGVVENEICPVLLCRVPGEPRPRADEVADVRWLPWPEVVELAARPFALSPWSRLQIAELERDGRVAAFLRATALRSTAQPHVLTTTGR